MKQKLLTLFALLLGVCSGAWAEVTVVGYTEAINGSNLDARVLSNGGLTNLTISNPIFGSAITDQGSKTVYIDNTPYTNNKSWRKSVNGIYDNQNVGYQLTVGSGYKMNISKVNARIAVADDTYTWYVEIKNSVGNQVWKSSERTTTKASSGKIDNVDVSDKEDIQGLTGTITVNLWVKQGGSTKYFSINYLQLSVELEADSRPNYTISANVADGQTLFGSIDKAGDNSVPQGDAISLTATANAGYGFVNWTKGGEVVSTNATLTLSNITANASYVANFKKLYKATYSLGEYAGTITGKVLCTYNAANGINEIYADIDNKYTIPAYAHKYLYREGYTFAGWSYGGNIYQSGDVISGLTSNFTIEPTWTATTQALSNASEATEVTWSLAKADMVFMDWQSSDKYGYYTQTAIVNGENIAIPMQITKGKIGNYSRTDALAQTNQDTQFTIPAVSGMVVNISNAYAVLSTTTVGGSTDYTGTGTKSISYTYTGNDATIDIVIGESGQYLTTISVIYPASSSEAISTPSGRNYASYVTTNKLDFASAEGITAFIATGLNGGGTAVELTPVDVVPASTPIIVKTETQGATVNVPVTTADASSVSGNKLVAGDGTTAWNGTVGYIYYYLAGDQFHLANDGTLQSGKAYLKIEEAVAARDLTFVFGDATSIKAIDNAQLTIDNYYNLSGQRVAQPKKGLYIKNGKKVIIK